MLQTEEIDKFKKSKKPVKSQLMTLIRKYERQAA